MPFLVCTRSSSLPAMQEPVARWASKSAASSKV